MELPLTPLLLVERGFELYADRPAVLDRGIRWSYQDLRQQVERMAGVLRRVDVAAGDRVALLAPNTVDAFLWYLAAPLAGAVLVPINTRLHPSECAYILDHSGARVLFVDRSLLALAEPLRCGRELTLVVLGAEGDGHPTTVSLAAGADPIPFSLDHIDERSVITLNYTSGTTARPKGVMQTHRNTYLNAINLLLAFHLQPEDVYLHVPPFFHANAWGFIWATAAVGAANVVLPKVEAEDVWRRIEEFGVSILGATATVFVRLLAAKPPHPRPLRVAMAGAPPPAEVIRRVETELGWDVTHLYGLTETTAFLTYCEPRTHIRCAPPEERARLKARQGVPLPLTGRVRVVRPDGREVRADGREVGEVVAQGNVVMAGYYHDPEATREAFRDGWFHTGDLAVRHPDGYLEIKDRAKDMIISGGENIPSLEVEGVLYTHPAVAEVAVVAGPHPFWGETPVAFVVCRPGHAVTAEELIQYCRQHLAHFKVPRAVIFLEELPRTGSGKVQKYLLRREAAQRLHGLQDLQKEASERAHPGGDG